MRSRFLAIFAILTISSPAFAGGAGSGGGEGVYDTRTGRVHFIDLLSDEELIQITPFKNSLGFVLTQFPLCTKTLSKRLADSKFSSVIREVNPILESVANAMPSLAGDVSDFEKILPEFRVTATELRQIADATRGEPFAQIQLGYYMTGISYLQEQALSLMPHEEIKGLLIKEMLRFWTQRKNAQLLAISFNDAHIENKDLEEATRLLYFGQLDKFRESNFIRKISVPLPIAALQPTGPSEQEQFDAQFAQNLQKLKIRLADPKNQTEVESYNAERGILPPWIDPQPRRDTRFNVAPIGRGWNIFTGSLVWNPSCSDY